jgi:hypothetical protein
MSKLAAEHRFICLGMSSAASISCACILQSILSFPVQASTVQAAGHYRLDLLGELSGRLTLGEAATKVAATAQLEKSCSRGWTQQGQLALRMARGMGWEEVEIEAWQRCVSLPCTCPAHSAKAARSVRHKDKMSMAQGACLLCIGIVIAITCRASIMHFLPTCRRAACCREAAVQGQPQSLPLCWTCQIQRNHQSAVDTALSCCAFRPLLRLPFVPAA